MSGHPALIPASVELFYLFSDLQPCPSVHAGGNSLYFPPENPAFNLNTASLHFTPVKFILMGIPIYPLGNPL